jgi:hypothetical protein
MARLPDGPAQTAIREQKPPKVACAALRAGYFLPRLRPEINTGRSAKCVSFELMVRLISANFSQLARGAVLSLPLVVAASGSMGCATPVPFALPSAGADGLGGDPNASGGAPDLGGAPAVGGDDGSSAGSVSTAGDASSGGDTSSGGDSSAGASSSNGGSGTFGGATSFGGSSAGAPAAGATSSGGSATAGSTGSAGAAAAGAPSAGASSGGASAGGSCAAAYANAACLNLNVGTQVSSGGHNWTCNDANCRNCATYPACAPGAPACPWGAVWTDNGTCT